MTIRPMKRAGGVVLAAVVVCALALPACGEGEEAAAASKAGAEQAEMLDEALTEIDTLTERTEELEAELAALEEAKAGNADDLDQVSERLWKSLGKLRESISDVKASSGSASADASTASANASAALRDLTILENRFEYHLRQHGGG